MLSNNSLTELADAVFFNLTSLNNFVVSNNLIMHVGPRVFARVFGHVTFTNNSAHQILVLDMAGNPTVCNLGWLPVANRTTVFCECAPGTIGTSYLAAETGLVAAMDTLGVAVGCSYTGSLGIVRLPSILIAEGHGTPVSISMANISSPMAQATEDQLCGGVNASRSTGVSACCTANFSNTTTSSPASSIVPDITLVVSDAAIAFDSGCIVAPGFVATIAQCEALLLPSFQDYFLTLQGARSLTFLPVEHQEISFTYQQPGHVATVAQAFVVNPLYSASNAFVVHPALPEGLFLDPANGDIYGTAAQVLLPASIYLVTQLTSLSGSAPCSHPAVQLHLSIIPCDSRSCHGGECLSATGDDSDRRGTGNSSNHGVPFRCKCAAQAAGQFCELANPFIPGSESQAMVASLFVALAVAASVAALHAHARRLRLANDSLTERLLETEEENMSLHRAWLIQPSELEVQGEIARGAFGIVLRAEWNHISVAVKKLLSAENKSGLAGNNEQGLLLKDATANEEFDREVSFMRTVRHPNIVTFFGVGAFEDGQPFLVTELMERGSLRVVLANSPTIDWATKQQFARDTALGMAHLHSLGSIHRDLKSGNLLVTQGFRVKVADFGTARLRTRRPTSQKALSNFPSSMVDQPAANTLMTGMVGTALWMAPEILFKQPYTQKADVYSYGIVLFEILTQMTPWNELPSKFMVNHLDAALRAGQRPRIMGEPYAQPGYKELMERCWAQRQEDRPTFAEVLSDSALRPRADVE